MRKLISDRRAKFSYATMDILKSVLCCIQLFPLRILRKSIKGRTVMNYKLGENQIDKEIDLGNIVNKIRTLNYFMKMILD